MLDSRYWSLGPVALPNYQGRQSYMHTFDLAFPEMQKGFEDYLEPVRELCRRAKAFSGVAHMTVDEKVVQAGMSQRRPGPHVDGCFTGKTWSHPPTWNHYCNDTGMEMGRMPVIIAASEPGCKVFSGRFDGYPKEDGDLSHLQLPEGTVLKSNTGYLLSADCVHESMLMVRDTQRTFLRIALPVGFQLEQR